MPTTATGTCEHPTCTEGQSVKVRHDGGPAIYWCGGHTRADLRAYLATLSPATAR